MRLAVLALVLLGLAGPASAQSRFVNACVASSADEESIDREQAQALCACGAERALLPERGISAARLDALVDYTDPEAGYDLRIDDDTPEAVQETAIVAVGSLLECMVTQGMEGLASEFVAASTAEGTIEPGAEARSKTAAPPTAAPQRAAPRRATGLRTGNGTEPVYSRQQGNGATIRIVG